MSSIEPRIVVFGCGGWGKNIVRTLAGLGQLHGIVDPTEPGRALANELAPDVPVHASPEAVWADESVTGVMIATPAETHYTLACRAIAHGCDVFVEKPMTIDLDEARDLVARAESANRILMVGHLLEYHPAIGRLHELITAGELGDIRYLMSNRLNLGKIRTEENALWSFAPHDIAVILRFVGAMPIEVVATGGSYITPDIADVTVTQLLFENGVRSHIFVSWLHPFKEQKLVVIGSKKMASFDDVTKELLLYDQRVDWQQGEPIPIRGEGVRVEFSGEEPLREECMHFVEAMRTRSRPRTDGQSGLNVLRVLQSAQKSLTSNGKPVRIASDVNDTMVEPRVTVKTSRRTAARS